MEFLRTLMRLITALADHHVEYILIGGAALNVHGLARATQDIDLFIAPNDANVERLKSALRAVWDDPHIEEISAADLCDQPRRGAGPISWSLKGKEKCRRQKVAVWLSRARRREAKAGKVIGRCQTPRPTWLHRGAVSSSLPIAQWPHYPRVRQPSREVFRIGAEEVA